jgi:hypothetical protein
VHELKEPRMTRISPRRSYLPRIAIAIAIAMLTAGCASSSEADPTEPASTVDPGTTAPSEPAVSEPVLHLRGDDEVAIYADGRVIWAIGDGNPGYLQRRLTPGAVERLRSSAVSTGLFELNQRLTLDHRRGIMAVRLGSRSMEVRRGDRSVTVAWEKDRRPARAQPYTIDSRSAARFWARAILERTSAATTEQEIEVGKLVAFFRDPTAWRLSRPMYVQPETSPFVPSRLRVVYDRGEPDWSTLPSPAREIIGSSRLAALSRRDQCRVISTDQARKIARALTQAGIDAGYDGERGLFGFSGLGSFVHSRPALPHEVAC